MRIGCSRLLVSEDDRKSKRATSRISSEQDQGEKRRGRGEPVSILLKTSFRPLEKGNRFLFQNVKYQNFHMFGIELLAQVSRGQAVLCSSVNVRVSCVSETLSVEVSV